MRKFVSNKLVKIAITFCLLICLTACKKKEVYLVKDYLNDLAYYSGVAIEYEIEETFEKLKDWGIVKEEEKVLLDDNLNYGYLGITLSRFLGNEEGITYLKANNYLQTNKKDSASVNKEDALKAIQNVVNVINNPYLENKYYIDEKDEVKHLKEYHYYNNQLITNEILDVDDLVYLENDGIYIKIDSIQEHGYKTNQPDIGDVCNEFFISGSSTINFENAEIIPGEGVNDLAYEETNYVNHCYTLLASKRHSFSKDGFEISYSFKNAGLDVRVAKKIAKGPNLFFDISLSNLKPSFKWDFEDGKLNEAFLKLDFQLTNELGVSIGKYDNYYLDLKDKDAKSFLSAIKKDYDYKEDELEATIKICTIKTQIPNLPFADLNIDVIAKLYATGKIEVVLYNQGTLGFEIKDQHFRIVHEVDKDSDFLIGASARAVAGLNFNVGANNFRLMDIEFDAGIRAAVSSTLHLYDKDGIENEEEVEIPYSILTELTKENPNVYVCGDISLNWVFDVQCNTSKTFLHKYGLTYKKSFLNTKNQVFGNLTHIENWQFVKKCTRKGKSTFQTKATETKKINIERIVLSTYSKVIIKGESYELPIIAIPDGYHKSDLKYTSNDMNVANCFNGIVEAYESGACSIDIQTKDGKYKASINILVSTG